MVKESPWEFQQGGSTRGMAAVIQKAVEENAQNASARAELQLIGALENDKYANIFSVFLGVQIALAVKNGMSIFWCALCDATVALVYEQRRARLALVVLLHIADEVATRFPPSAATQTENFETRPWVRLSVTHPPYPDEPSKFCLRAHISKATMSRDMAKKYRTEVRLKRDEAAKKLVNLLEIENAEAEAAAISEMIVFDFLRC